MIIPRSRSCIAPDTISLALAEPSLINITKGLIAKHNRIKEERARNNPVKKFLGKLRSAKKSKRDAKKGGKKRRKTTKRRTTKRKTTKRKTTKKKAPKGRKIHKGPRGGKYYMRKGRKVYV